MERNNKIKMKIIFSIVIFTILFQNLTKGQNNLNLNELDTIVNNIRISYIKGERAKIISYSYNIYNAPEFYNSLNKYSKDLYPVFFYEYLHNGNEKVYSNLLGLLTLPDTALTILKADSLHTLPLRVKAKLFGGLDEIKLIEKFELLINDTLNTEEIKNASGDLLYVNSPGTLKSFFNAFQSDKIYKTKYIETDYVTKTRYLYTIEISLFAILRKVLYNYYPYPIFYSGEDKYIKERKILERADNKVIQPYYNEVDKLVDSVFNIKIDIKTPCIRNTIDIKEITN